MEVGIRRAWTRGVSWFVNTAQIGVGIEEQDGDGRRREWGEDGL